MRLFDRNTRHVELTVDGQVLDATARRLLADMDLVMEDLRDHAARRRGRVALAALPSLAAGWLPGLLARFRESYPGITVDLRDALLDPCLDLVQAGQVDFAVASRRPDMNDLDSEFLHADRYFLVCRADHPLAGAGRARLRDILRYPMIQLARGSSVRKHLDAALGADAPAPVFEVEHLATATGLVRAGLGISVVPAMTLFHFGGADLRIVPLAGKALTRPLYLVRRKGRTLSVAAQALYDLLREHRGDIDSPGRHGFG
jgi:DNA-binding transcriptional LysR family regulator